MRHFNIYNFSIFFIQMTTILGPRNPRKRKTKRMTKNPKRMGLLSKKKKLTHFKKNMLTYSPTQQTKNQKLKTRNLYQVCYNLFCSKAFSSFFCLNKSYVLKDGLFSERFFTLSLSSKKCAKSFF